MEIFIAHLHGVAVGLWHFYTGLYEYVILGVEG